MPKIKLIEIARSFSYKKNLGNFENVDFFCSQKAEVPEEEAVKTSEALYQFCKKEVMKSVESYGKPEPIDLDKAVKQGEQWKQEIYNEDSKIQTTSEETKLPIITE